MKIDVVLPAGGRIAGAFSEAAGAEIKALITLSGKTVIENTIERLRETGLVNRIVVIGPDELSSHESCISADLVLPEGGNSGPANIIRGLTALKDLNGGTHADRVLAVTTDLPFLSAEAINGFIEQCSPDADICAPIIRREVFESSYPGFECEFVRLKDGEWTMGCAFMLNPMAVERNLKHIEGVFAVRKSQIGMARLLGLRVIIKFLTGKLSVEDIESRCHGILGCLVDGVVSNSPELAFDLDHLEEYRYAAGVLESQAGTYGK